MFVRNRNHLVSLGKHASKSEHNVPNKKFCSDFDFARRKEVGIRNECENAGLEFLHCLDCSRADTHKVLVYYRKWSTIALVVLEFFDCNQ